MKIKNQSRAAFTLIELLTVIAIIGILAAILIPAVGAVRKKASQAKSSSNLRQIALAYNNFSTSGGRTRVIGDGAYDPASNPTQADSPEDWAAVLAQGAGLTDGQLYFIDSDPAIGGATLPKAIGFKDDSGLFAVTEAWSTLDSELIGYEMVVGMSANAQGSITPLIWTKGLQNDGTWDTTINPWGSDGGHIAFMDGHVEFFDNVAQPQQLVTNTAAGGTVGSPTANIEDAIASTTNARIIKPVSN